MPFLSSRRRLAAAWFLGLALPLAPFAPRLAAQDAAPSPTPLPTTAPSPSPEPKTGTVENSVVKVFATVRYPDPYKPWSKQAPHDITGSGAVIEGHRILTNAHVVLYASQIQIQANQAGDKLAATVEAVAPGIDLAVLKIDDAGFFDTHAPLPLVKELPGIKDAVMVYGYPEGSTTLSITKGIVSRIEFVPYNPPTRGLRVQIDAAINPGNSGGPAVAGDHMMGLAFSRLTGGAENIGYIIPAEEIELFLQDIADGHYDGKPTIFDLYQTLENPALRTFLKLDKSVEGVVIHQPDDATPDNPLKEWDVVTKIGDVPVDDQGMIRLSGGLKVNFEYMTQKITRGGKVPLTLVRAGKEMTVELPVSARRPTLIPDLEGGYPSYFVCGPMAFTEASTLFLSGLGGHNSSYMGALVSRGSPLIARLGDKEAFPGERLVVVSSPFFPDKLATGYGSPFAEVVDTVNGIKIKNLAHLVEVLRDCKDEFVVLAYYGRGGETTVFPRAALVSSTEDILTDNGVRSQGSPDMMAVWKKPADKTASMEGADSQRPISQCILNITVDGSVILNRQTLTCDQLRAKLKQLAAIHPDQAVILRADEKAPYSDIVGVLDTCREANIWNVAFATAKPQS